MLRLQLNVHFVLKMGEFDVNVREMNGIPMNLGGLGFGVMRNPPLCSVSSTVLFFEAVLPKKLESENLVENLLCALRVSEAHLEDLGRTVRICRTKREFVNDIGGSSSCGAHSEVKGFDTKP